MVFLDRYNLLHYIVTLEKKIVLSGGSENTPLHTKELCFSVRLTINLSFPLAMTTRLLWRALCLLVLLCTVSPFGSATNHPDPSAPEQGVTFSHVYKIDIPGSSSCKLERLPTQDETGHIQKWELEGERMQLRIIKEGNWVVHEWMNVYAESSEYWMEI